MENSKRGFADRGIQNMHERQKKLCMKDKKVLNKKKLNQ